MFAAEAACPSCGANRRDLYAPDPGRPDHALVIEVIVASAVAILATLVVACLWHAW